MSTTPISIVSSAYRCERCSEQCAARRAPASEWVRKEFMEGDSSWGEAPVNDNLLTCV
jgi:hypothetical protein